MLTPEELQALCACKACGLHETCANPFLSGRGDGSSGLALVGEAPGPVEEDVGAVFSGASGVFLESILEEMGIAPGTAYLTNANKCRPPTDSEGNEGKASPGQITACRPALKVELAAIEPRVIVCLGKAASHAVLGIQKIGEIRGRVFEVYGAKVVPTWHPAYVLRAKQDPWSLVLDQFCGDLNKVAALLRGEEAARLPPAPGVPETTDGMLAVIRRAMAAPWSAFDFETGGGARAWSSGAHLLMVALAWPENGQIVSGVVNLGHPLAPNVEDNLGLMEIAEEFRAYLRNPAPKVVSFLPMEHSWCVRHLGVELAGELWDIGLEKHTCDQESFSGFGLKAIAWDDTPFGGYDRALRLWCRANDVPETGYQAVPYRILATYGGYDAYVTAHAHAEVFLPRLRELGLEDFYRRYMLPNSLALCRLRENGCVVSRPEGERLIEGLERDLALAEQALDAWPKVKDYSKRRAARDPDKWRRKIKVLSGAVCKNGTPSKRQILKPIGDPIPLNWGSSAQVADFLYGPDGLRLEVKDRTEKGRPSVTSATLVKVAARYPLLRSYGERVTAAKLASTFVRPFVSGRWEDEDGRVRSTYFLTGTRTGGRPTSARPNLNNIPREGTAEGIKAQWVSRFADEEAGGFIVEADQGQIEARIIAAISGDEGMLAAIRAGGDLHRQFAAMAFGKPASEVTAEERQKAKGALSFGLFYGRQAPGLALSFGWDLDYATSFRDGFLEQIPAVPRWWASCLKRGRETGMIRMRHGRLARTRGLFGDHVGHAERHAINAEPQAMAADIVLNCVAVVESYLRETGKRARCVATVYDSVVVDTPAEELLEVCLLLRDVFTHPPLGEDELLGVPLACDLKVGRTWRAEAEIKAATSDQQLAEAVEGLIRGRA